MNRRSFFRVLSGLAVAAAHFGLPVPVNGPIFLVPARWWERIFGISDSDKLRAAIASLSPVGGTIFLGEGVYRMDSLPQDIDSCDGEVRIVGAGAEKTAIDLSDEPLVTEE